ncbi:hypothetical protein BBW65_00830 [Helicobacter enhydrae]|uniref:Outer membrane protein n=1 Tax=Helicobacter enhydrae TaxID=222136 RepID=A0A1B1U3W8_9HELI|nr:hypothetical protein [Helicobacter enhydrae]ANV97446.1 hypothetical protein BBW65_00830 [Helicobacter enhydrae]
MKKKVMSALALSGLLASSASAASVDAFGHIGTAYNFGLKNEVSTAEGGKKPWFGGATARAGVEIGFGAVSIGVGATGGLPYAISPSSSVFGNYVRNGYFTKPSNVEWYNWISDAYLRADSSLFSFIGGRYNLGEFFDGKDGLNPNGVDWVSGQHEGLSFILDTRYFAWWGTYSYEMMNYGAENPGRFGNDLMGFNQYYKTGHYLSTGFDIRIKDILYIDPFATYVVDSNLLQLGGKLDLRLGRGTFKSTTTLRGMYQAYTKGYSQSTYLGWIDQEFLVSNLVKFGGGFYSVGKNHGIHRSSDKARFYGNTFGSQVDYFAHGVNSWYGFIGLTDKYFSFDFLYAGGDYQEISAIANVNLYKDRFVEFGLGGGWVRSNHHDQAVAFTKLSF